MSPSTNEGMRADAQKKARHQKILKLYFWILVIGGAYAIFVIATKIAIPCPIYTVMHLQCPGCGVTRMILALLRLDFAAAWAYNPYLLINGPIILGCLIASDVKYIRTGDRSMGKLSIVLWAELALAIGFAIFRNLI